MPYVQPKLQFSANNYIKYFFPRLFEEFCKHDPNFLQVDQQNKIDMKLVWNLEFCFIYDSFNVLNDLIGETPLHDYNYMFKKLYLDIMILCETCAFGVFGVDVEELEKFKELQVTKVDLKKR